MSALTVEQPGPPISPAIDTAPQVRPGRRQPEHRRTKRRGAGAGQPPVARPQRFAPVSAGACTAVTPRGCVGEPAAVRHRLEAPHWRLTDRGVAVILVTMLMIMVAGLTVVGLTALRVTGDGYVGAGPVAVAAR